MLGKYHSAAQHFAYPSVEDAGIPPLIQTASISYGIPKPTVWKHLVALWTAGVDPSTGISSVEKRLINEPAQGAIDPPHHRLIFTLITLSTAWQFNTVGEKQLWSCPHLHQFHTGEE